MIGAALTILVGVAAISTVQRMNASLMAAGPSRQEPGATAAVSVLDGVFTSDQARRGGETFHKVCAACHTIADHSGRAFESKWNGASVGELYELISSTMPDGTPASLTPEEYASVIAFFLQQTGYPEGQRELPAEPEKLKNLRIEALPAK